MENSAPLLLSVRAGGILRLALAAKIAAKPRATLTLGKEAFYRQMEMPLDQAYDYATGVMTRNMLDAEAYEGIDSFLAKREPKWPS